MSSKRKLECTSIPHNLVPPIPKKRKRGKKDDTIVPIPQPMVPCDSCANFEEDGHQRRERNGQYMYGQCVIAQSTTSRHIRRCTNCVRAKRKCTFNRPRTVAEDTAPLGLESATADNILLPSTSVQPVPRNPRPSVDLLQDINNSAALSGNPRRQQTPPDPNHEPTSTMLFQPSPVSAEVPSTFAPPATAFSRDNPAISPAPRESTRPSVGESAVTSERRPDEGGFQSWEYETDMTVYDNLEKDFFGRLMRMLLDPHRGDIPIPVAAALNSELKAEKLLFDAAANYRLRRQGRELIDGQIERLIHYHTDKDAVYTHPDDILIHRSLKSRSNVLKSLRADGVFPHVGIADLHAPRFTPCSEWNPETWTRLVQRVFHDFVRTGTCYQFENQEELNAVERDAFHQ
ncbi:hypothetical protein C8J56DRAFT_1164839 [Mycena floridula]|nr:hypothetical protein C8J56DRAFT_1164839 [Mycena floridula]